MRDLSRSLPGVGNLLRGSGIYLASNICSAVIPFAMMPVLTRFLGPYQYGQVGMFQALVGAVSALTGFSVVGAATRKRYDTGLTQPQMAEFIGACLQVLLASSILLFIPLYFFRELIAAKLGLEPRWVLGAAAVAAGAFLLNLRLGQWQVLGRARNYGLLQVGATLAPALLSLLLVVVLLQGASGQISAQILMAPCVGAIAIWLLYRERLLRLSWRPAMVTEALAFGVPLIPHVVGLFVLRAGDRLVIQDQLGLEQAGIYVSTVQLTLVMAIVFDAVNKAFMPWLFEHLKRNDPQEKALVVRATYAYFLLALGVAGLAFLVGPMVVRVVAGRGFEAAGSLVGWLALGQAFSGMYLMVTNYIFFSKKTGLLSLVTIGSGAMNVALLLALVPAFGMVGAAWSFAIAMGVRFLLVWVVAQHQHPMPWMLSTKSGA